MENLDINTIMIISAQMVSTVTIVISVVVLFVYHSKKIDNLQKEINTKFAEVKNEITEMKIEIVKIGGKFEKKEVENKAMIEKIDRVENYSEITNKRIDKIEIDNKEIIGKVLDKLQTA